MRQTRIALVSLFLLLTGMGLGFVVRSQETHSGWFDSTEKLIDANQTWGGLLELDSPQETAQYSNSSLNGTYVGMDVGGFSGGVVFGCQRTMQFNGRGIFSSSWNCRETNYRSSSGSSAGTYSVSPNGSVVMVNSSGDPINGVVCGGGDAFFLAYFVGGTVQLIYCRRQ